MTKETIVKYEAAETAVEVAKCCIIYTRDSEDGKARIEFPYTFSPFIRVKDNERFHRLYDRVNALLCKFIDEENAKAEAKEADDANA